MGEKPHRLPQQSEAGGLPVRLDRHGAQQIAPALVLVLGLQRTTVILGLAEDPAVIGAHQVLLEHHLRDRNLRIRLPEKLIRSDFGKKGGNPIPVFAQLHHALVKLAVLDAAAAVPACVFPRRMDGAVVAEPADLFERAAGGGFHLRHPAPQAGLIGESGRWSGICRTGSEQEAHEEKQGCRRTLHLK